MSAKNLMNVRDMLPGAFNDFFKPWNEWFDANGVAPASLTVPAVNVTEDEDSYKVSLAIPGRKKEDFNIDVFDDRLTISSQTKEEKEEQNKRYTRKEYSYSSFSRSFALPDNVTKEKIEAGYTDGILEIVLPKNKPTPKEDAQKIAVK